MKSINDMSMEELGAYVCLALEKEGVDTVLLESRVNKLVLVQRLTPRV